jgi:hypothetical protein
VLTEEMEFDSIALIEVPVKIAGVKYTLREASGEAVCAYRDAQIEGTVFNAEGKPVSVKGLSQVNMLLLSYCLFDDKGTNVPLAVIKAWPNRVIEPLAERVKEISELNTPEKVANPS